MNTVLVVDDSRDDIQLAEMAIGASKCRVRIEVALNGEAALKFLRGGEEVPALILLDLKMCGMNGIETLRNIRADARMKQVPVVVVTSSSLPSDEKEAFDAGADGYLRKALDIKEFTRDIKSLLDRWIFNSN